MPHLRKIPLVGSVKCGCPTSRLFCEKWERDRGRDAGCGCPIPSTHVSGQALARSWRKGGPLCSLHKATLSVLALTLTMATSACRIDMHVQPRQNPLSHSDFYPDQRS